MNQATTTVNHQPFPKETHNLRLSTNRLYFAGQNTVGFYESGQPQGFATTINHPPSIIHHQSSTI
ncbi:MAG: hypothetical protein IKV67_07480, partial [Paludibacteraceae bacterium]|nr:hypothetical protein [Paludibacteraceae bacterium]